MQRLYLDLKSVADNHVELRYFIDNPNQYEKRSLPITNIADLIKLAERDYYVADLPEDYTVSRQRLYKWLDGSDRPLAHFPNSSFNNTGSFFSLRKVRKAIAHYLPKLTQSRQLRSIRFWEI